IKLFSILSSVMSRSHPRCPFLKLTCRAVPRFSDASLTLYLQTPALHFSKTKSALLIPAGSGEFTERTRLRLPAPSRKRWNLNTPLRKLVACSLPVLIQPESEG